jgi:hypothetical protein
VQFGEIRVGAWRYGSATGRVLRRHRSEQYLTCSQSRSHFLRQVNGSWQWAQILVGNDDFLRIFMR